MAESSEAALDGRRTSTTWAQRLNRVFNIDIETRGQCGGAVKVIARIEDPAIIKQILTHLVRKRHSAEATPLPQSRAPPGAGLFD